MRRCIAGRIQRMQAARSPPRRRERGTGRFASGQYSFDPTDMRCARWPFHPLSLPCAYTPLISRFALSRREMQAPYVGAGIGTRSLVVADIMRWACGGRHCFGRGSSGQWFRLLSAYRGKVVGWPITTTLVIVRWQTGANATFGCLHGLGQGPSIGSVLRTRIRLFSPDVAVHVLR